MDRHKYARDYLVKKGLNPTVAAGIVGNLHVESGGLSDDVINFSRRGDQGSAYGIAQWRGDRKNNLLKFTGNRAKTLEGQLDFLYHELTTDKNYKFDKINSAKTPSEAAKLFMDIYERPNKDPKINHIKARMQKANSVAGLDVDSNISLDSYQSNFSVPDSGQALNLDIKGPQQVTLAPNYGQSYQPEYKSDVQVAKEEIKYAQAVEAVKQQAPTIIEQPQELKAPSYSYLHNTNLFTLQ